MSYSTKLRTALLSPGDPEPLEFVNPHGDSGFVLCCEHAGQHVPRKLGDLGVQSADMDRHIAYDVGAEPVARQLSRLLDAPLFLQRYSRLVIDCNRPFGAKDLIPEASDATPVPANVNISEEQRRTRYEKIHIPFHTALSRFLDRRSAARKPTSVVAVHSFTPKLNGGSSRPWHLGALSNRDPSFAKAFLSAFRSNNPDRVVAHNEPYVVDDMSDYTIPVHGEARGLPHVLLEIRNDLIVNEEGQRSWALLIAEALYLCHAQKRVA